MISLAHPSNIRELFKKISFVKTRDQYKFAFIVHPRNRSDIHRKFPFFRHLPNFITDLFTKYYPPMIISNIEGLKSIKTNKEIKGYLISIMPTAHQMMEDRKLALKRITQACLLAERKGVKIVGLGGLTSSLSKGGLDLLNNVGVGITTGHAYTSYNVTQNIFSLIEYMELDIDKISIAVVGAAGSIGSTTAMLLAKKGIKKMLFVDLERKKKNCNDLSLEITRINPAIKVEISHQIGDIKDSDIIVAATNAPEALIQSKDLKWGAIVVDDAQPSDVHSDVYSRKDVLIIEAGVTSTPGIKNNFNFGLKDRFDNFCCLAEVLILAANGWDKHYVINRASLDLVDEITKLGSGLNFRIGKYQNFKELITDEKMLFVKKCIKQNEF